MRKVGRYKQRNEKSGNRKVPPRTSVYSVVWYQIYC